jgi:flagellar biosynthesis/type III secretory pathway chaperone
VTPAAATDAPADPERMLAEQLESAESMLAVLDLEYQALLDGDPETLNRVSADKARLVEDLESLERARQDLADPGSAASRSGDSRWQRLLETVEQCRSRNLRNGALANARREQLTTALNLLRGSENRLYDGSGAVARGPGSRDLGQA